MEGTVKWFNRSKGFGFITGEDGVEYFVHHSALAEGKFLKDNDRVSFEPVDTERGKQSQNVVLLQKGSEIEGAAPAEESVAEEKPAEATEEPVAEEPAPVVEDKPSEAVELVEKVTEEEPVAEEKPAEE